MKEEFKLLKKEFTRIKNMGLIKPLRKGTTGIGYTFETLLSKEEDQDCKPDFKGIELKTKLGYSKSPMTLFHCEPKRHSSPSINYIFDKYSYPKYNNKNVLLFESLLYANKFTKKYKYKYRLVVDYYGQQVIMKSYFDNIFLEDVCYWDFKVLENKLKIKLSNLAIIYAYPYKKENQLYYKYLKISYYKLRGFFEFLKLIENGKIHIQFYLKKELQNSYNLENNIENHGVAFRIEIDNIEDLFIKLKY